MWLVEAVVAMLCFAGMQLLFKRLTEIGLGSPVILVFVFGFGALLYLGHLAVVRPPVAVGGRTVALLAAAAALSYAGNLLMVRAVGRAPNPGYAVVVTGMQGLVVTLAAVALFGSDFTPTKGVGVALAVLGMALLAL